ncbi:MAG: VacJ family lipoprotein, partial [Xanthomonadales bacterium]|nr:VacJ family lipoprotein [Xanthomonadales bacterium]
YFHPVSYVARQYNNYIPMVVDLIALRAELLPFQAELEAASDPYALVRDVYLQNREYRIYDGDPPETDYDALLEEY